MYITEDGISETTEDGPTSNIYLLSSISLCANRIKYKRMFQKLNFLSAPERSEGAEVFKKHVRDADDHVGAKCEIRSRRGLSTAPSVCLSVCLSVCYLPY